jgi:hypothetical protein
MRDIEPGEELLYDHVLEIDEPITEESIKEYECLCGSPSCRGTMLGLSSSCTPIADRLATPQSHQAESNGVSALE